MFHDSICLKYFLHLSSACASELFLLSKQKIVEYMELLLATRTPLDMLIWSKSIGQFVYHVGLSLLIVKIAQFLRKEGRKAGLKSLG